MKDLQLYVMESGAVHYYGILLDFIELPKIPSAEKLTQLIKEGITEANSRYKVLRIKAIEELNKNTEKWNEERLKEALPEQEKKVIANMQNKPGIMKRSEEGRQKYIKSRLEAFKSKFYKAPLRSIEYDENKISFGYHFDIYNDNGYLALNSIDAASKRVAKEIDEHRENPLWKDHFKGIYISVDNNELSKYYSPTFHIIPMFDEETEKSLSKEMQKFQDYMSAQYNSNKYMGD